MFKPKAQISCSLIGIYLLLVCSCSKHAQPESVETKIAIVRAALQNSAPLSQLQAQVDGLFKQFGGDKEKPIMVSEIPPASPLMKLQDTLKNGDFYGIEPKDAEGKLAPSHIQIRFGDHSHYDFVLIFPTGTDISESTISPLFHQVTNNVYLDPNIGH